MRHEALAGARADDPGAVTGMYREFSSLGAYEKHVIDPSAMSPEQAAQVVRRLVATGQMRVSGG